MTVVDQSICVSTHNRFCAALVARGLRHPPMFAGGDWSDAETRAFRACASLVSTLTAGRVDIGTWRRMETALRQVRQCLLVRDPDCWPALPTTRAGSAPLDFSMLIAWGAESWWRKLHRRADAPAIHASMTAIGVVNAAAVAINVAGDGGQPACANRTLTPRIDALDAALAKLQARQATHTPVPRDLRSLASCGAARSGRLSPAGLAFVR